MEPEKTQHTPVEDEDVIAQEDHEMLQKLNSDSTTQSDGLSFTGQSSNSKPKLRKRFIWLGIVAVVLVAVLAGLIYYFAQPVKQNNNATTKVAVTSTGAKNSNESTKKSSQQLVKDLKSTLTNGVDDKDAYITAAKPDGYNFYSFADKIYEASSTGTKQAIDKDREALRATFKQKGYKEVVNQALTYDGSTVVFESEYQDSNLKCMIMEIDTAHDNKYKVSVSCADMSSYANVAKEAKSFVEIYAASAKKDVSNNAFSSPNIKKGGSDGYQQGQLGVSGSHFADVGGFAALFYQTPDAVWHFFTGTQSMLSCDMFNTIDLKKAYLGLDCFAADGTTENKVSL